ncbi:MAG: hypothetical protein K2M31_00245 [Muribaculaceae bacterium]|nr:hypothetical protein [Muribaculaceae bacterium]
MKGYSPRERFGLIVLILVVIGLFLTERLIDSAGCERVDDQRETPEQRAAAKSDSTSEWMSRKDRSEAHRRSDSIRNLKKSPGYRNDDGKKKRMSGKSRKRDKKSSPKSAPVQRSLRDERL